MGTRADGAAELRDAVFAAADRYGAHVGIAGLGPFGDVAAEMRRRDDDGTRGGLTFTYLDVDRATTPSIAFPWAESAIVLAVGYLEDGDRDPPVRTVARFATGDRYRRLVTVLEAMRTVVRESRWRAEIVYDDGRIVDRAMAVRAGVGWWGKSTMVLTPGLGPWTLIGSVLTDAPLEPTEPMRRTCGSCVACIVECPTGAISDDGVLDARRCLAAVFQARGPIPAELRVAAGPRIYGCDDCLTACPPGFRALRAVSDGQDELDPATILSLSDAELARVVDHWYVPGRKMRYVRRNALIALGNTGRAGAWDLALDYVKSADPLLRSHALWALDAIDHDAAVVVAGDASKEETDPDVIAEITSITGGP